MKLIKDINLSFSTPLFGHIFCSQHHARTENAKMNEEGFLIVRNLSSMGETDRKTNNSNTRTKTYIKVQSKMLSKHDIKWFYIT